MKRCVSVEIDKSEFEKILRDNLLSAYLDYVVDFGEKKALEILSSENIKIALKACEIKR